MAGHPRGNWTQTQVSCPRPGLNAWGLLLPPGTRKELASMEAEDFDLVTPPSGGKPGLWGPSPCEQAGLASRGSGSSFIKWQE